MDERAGRPGPGASRSVEHGDEELQLPPVDLLAGAEIVPGCDRVSAFWHCEVWPNVIVRPPLARAGGLSASLVYLDPGGPGFDSIASASLLSAIVPRQFDGDWVAILVESWVLSDGFSQECKEAIDDHIGAIRTAGDQPPWRRLVDDCAFEEMRTPMSSVSRQLASLATTVETTRTGLVGLSFGGVRVEVLTGLGSFDALMTDSAPSGQSGAEFVRGLGTRLQTATERLLGQPIDGRVLARVDQMPTDGLTIDFGSNDAALALYGASLTPQANQPWAQELASTTPASDVLARNTRLLADGVLRHEGYDHYDISWAGYYAEICGTWAGWPSEELSNEPEFIRLLASLHLPCSDGANDVASRQTSPCQIYRDDDPVARVPLVQEVGVHYVLDIEHTGHRPLIASDALDHLLNEFWDVCEI